MKIKIKLSELLYFSAFFIWLFFNFIAQTNLIYKYPEIYRFRIVAMIVSIVILLFKLLLERHSSKFLIFFFSAFCLAIIIGISTHKLFDALTIISTILFIISINNVNFRKVLILWTVSIVFLMISIYGLLKFGIIENTLRVQLGGRFRFSQGYQYVTLGANYLFHLTLVYLYLRKSKIRLLEILMLGILNYYFYVNTDTKSAFFLSILALVLVYIFKNKVVSQKILNAIGKITLTAGILIPIILTYFYNANSKLFQILNVALTGRLSLGHKTLSLYGVHMFGQRIDWELQQRATSVFDNYLYVDSSFVNILLHYGVILLVVIWYSFYQLNKRGHFNTVEMLVFIVLILHSMFDPQFFELMYNPLLLLMGISWSKYRYNYQDV